MQTKNIDFNFEIKEDGQTIEGYASFFGNKDSYSDVVVKGAFVKSLRQRKPKMLWQHKSDEVIGIWEVLKEDEKGLYIKGKFADTQRGREARELAKIKAIDGLSIGFAPVTIEIDDKKNIRYLKEVDLFEVSLVTFPANEKATVTNVKSKISTIRDFEKFLREAGYSREEAKGIASRGFLYKERRDAELLEQKLNNLLNQFRGNSNDGKHTN